MNKPNLIYNDECDFCSELAHWLRDFIGYKEIKIVPNSLFENESVFKKDVHLVYCKTFRYDGNYCEVYSKGQALAYTLAIKPSLSFIKKLYDNILLVRFGFSITYYLLKKVKTIYNSIVGK